MLEPISRFQHLTLKRHKGRDEGFLILSPRFQHLTSEIK
ncbi:hypothetical protein SLEP1_g18235 [Rubroshorea leprosula]|uniref:Ycf15 n=1 Tax=Rubroshorea leprosula TaxID=152421 RepID=A0AAV5J2C4_9ROSI|nr:hypothetical protein SLEP1_g18235 [Rubroshorea leprosula]